MPALSHTLIPANLPRLIELGFLVAFTAVFHAKRLQRRFPTMSAYLTLKLIAFGVLQYAALEGVAAYVGFVDRLQAVIAAILAFFAWMEIYQDATSHLPGIARLGSMAFRWAAGVSVLITISTILPLHSSQHMLANMAQQLPRTLGTIELCLLAFLTLSLKSIGISLRSRNFGLILGFAFMAASDFTASMLELSPSVAFAATILSAAASATWLLFCLLPEQKLQMVTVPVNSTLYRWNEIAQALGHKGTQVVTLQQQAPASYFLSDVERAVEQAFNRTLNNNE